jgi:hypothetical protein
MAGGRIRGRQSESWHRSVSNEPDYYAIAARFRDFATLCRERAARIRAPEDKATMRRWAHRWERDAQRVMIDAEMVATSRALLDRLEDGNKLMPSLPSPP